MKIQILGSGCPNCKTLEARTKDAVETMGIQAEIIKITDMDEIVNMGVMMTPALAINGSVKTTGKVLSTDQVIEEIKAVL